MLKNLIVYKNITKTYDIEFWIIIHNSISGSLLILEKEIEEEYNNKFEYSLLIVNL